MLKIAKERIPESFEKIAKDLFSQYELKIGKDAFELVEIEFYYFSDNHQDGFVHVHEISEAGRLRLHGAGLDITFASNSDEYGGILIRSIKNIQTGVYTNGPILSADKLILSISLFEESSFKLEKKTEVKELNGFMKGIRVGLKNPKKETSHNETFRQAEYRFITDLVEANKFKKIP